MLIYQSLAYECGREGAPVASAVPTPQPPPKSSRPATVADFNGTFVGKYVCQQRETSMQLDTKAAANGDIVAVYSFGGTGDTPKGAFTLTGHWTSKGFVLEPHEWLDQPAPGYQMVGLDGALTDKGLAGRAVHNLCTTFDLVRQ
jgi:hypothetical protein